MIKHSVVCAAILCACTAVTSSAAAQSHEVVTTTGPNRELLHSGIFALGVPYVASVIVAASSDRSEDKKLYIPVAGPWLDYANRSACGVAGQPSCDAETAYKVLLIGDGILQSVGALEIVGSFLFPETRSVAKSTDRRVVVTPYYIGSGYGMSAFARF